MRIRVALQLARETAVPLNHQHFLTAVVYRFLEYSDADYARFLHGEGYAPQEGDRRRFKLFCFAPLRARRRRIAGNRLWLGPGEAEWIVCSPVEAFLTNFATGLLSEGSLRVGTTTLTVSSVETLPAPQLEECTRFKCLSPIVAAVPGKNSERTWTRYLRPKDPDFSERVRTNLLGKYSALHGHPPQDDNFKLEWDNEYLNTHRGTKLVTYKDINIVGAFAPFTLAGSTELMQLAYDAGLGEKNAGGFGCVEVAK